MPGRLRRRRRGGEAVPAETPETSSLPLLEAAGLAAGLPRALELAAACRAAGYFQETLLGQWRLVQALLLEHTREAGDPLGVALALARQPDPRARFHAPGLVAGLLAGRPRDALAVLRELARDPDPRVLEAVQAFGVRPQAEALGPDVVPLLRDWVADGDPGVRWTAVEATRARGVWVRRLDWVVTAPGLLLPILEPLRAEWHPRVARAVGNSLNDLSRDHPRLVADLAARWRAEPGPAPLLDLILRRALRTLVKAGDPAALRVLGFGELDVEARVRLTSGRPARPNTTLAFLLELRNRGPAADAHLVYEIETPGRVPGRPRRRRQHGGSLRLPGGDTLVLRLRERIFDRRSAPLLDGPCRARFWLNGRPVAELGFPLRRREGEVSARDGSGPAPGRGRRPRRRGR